MRVDVKALARDLCRCEGMTSRWYSHQPEYESDYLMFHFVLPCLRGEAVRLCDLDLDAFTYNDIGDMRDFFDNQYNAKNITVPCGLAEMATMSQPLCRHERAFC